MSIVYSVYTASASQKLRHLPTVCTADMLVAEKGNKKPTGESKVINVLQSDKWQAETCIRHTLTATLTHRIPTQLNQEQSSTYLSQHSDITNTIDPRTIINLPQSRLTHHQHDWPNNNHQSTYLSQDSHVTNTIDPRTIINLPQSRLMLIFVSFMLIVVAGDGAAHI